mmetsp:Transcript_27314/g.70886  ORF Transcript_27314/g.70886 Transcript_27314/m.70886 type:complete len:201 (-) Transcript_27314:30-632(-)
MRLDLLCAAPTARVLEQTSDIYFHVGAGSTFVVGTLGLELLCHRLGELERRLLLRLDFGLDHFVRRVILLADPTPKDMLPLAPCHRRRRIYRLSIRRLCAEVAVHGDGRFINSHAAAFIGHRCARPHRLSIYRSEALSADGTKSARWYDAPVSLASLARIKFAVLNHTQVCAPLQLSAKVLPVMLVALEESCVHGGEGYL